MNRFLYFAGFAYIALCGAVLSRFLRRPAPQVLTSGAPVAVAPPPPPPSRPNSFTSGQQWYASIKQYCNSVEVEVQQRYSPPPNTSEGAGYSAACFALAGKIDRARAIIDNMAAGDRGAAANVLFEVAHPVADAGDDRSSGPMMELVLQYWPNNYMALYHAGMSEFSLGEKATAEQHLKQFLAAYSQPDGFTNAARDALSKLDAGIDGTKKVEQEQPRPQ